MPVRQSLVHFRKRFSFLRQSLDTATQSLIFVGTLLSSLSLSLRPIVYPLIKKELLLSVMPFIVHASVS